MRISRRTFVGRGALAAGGAALLGPLAACGEEPRRQRAPGAGYGPLLDDPAGLLDLPRGFRYRILSRKGVRMRDGRAVPGDPDGMAAFPGPRGTTILMRNHELHDDEGPAVEGRNPHRGDAPGGTTAVVVGAGRRRVDDYVTSSGTRDNCAGGATPWGTWLTCEEDEDGQVFEVDPGDPENDLSRTPIRGMGRFSHEAIGIDPKTGIAYLTEDNYGAELPATPADEDDDHGAYLYRFVPDDRRPRPGALQRGGRLEVLAVEAGPRTLNADLYERGRRLGVAWRPVDEEDPRGAAKDTDGAIRFNRLEGAYFSGGAFWFDDTHGGAQRLGQIFRYRPATATLELFYEGTDRLRMNGPDNIVVTPWGDLWFAEDGENADGESEAKENRVMGVTPEGTVYPFARLSGSELAGPTFAPDGATFFVNAQGAGLTFAVWGPFRRASAARRRVMAFAAPPSAFAPRIGPELAEAARRHGMGTLEAAAYERLGVPLA